MVELGNGMRRTGTVYALRRETGMGSQYSVPPSNGVVTEVWCSEVRKTWDNFSAFELSHRPREAGPGRRLETVLPAQGRGRVQILRWKF